MKCHLKDKSTLSLYLYVFLIFFSREFITQLTIIKYIAEFIQVDVIYFAMLLMALPIIFIYKNDRKKGILHYLFCAVVVYFTFKKSS
jgi:hypothetical protein